MKGDITYTKGGYFIDNGDGTTSRYTPPYSAPRSTSPIKRSPLSNPKPSMPAAGAPNKRNKGKGRRTGTVGRVVSAPLAAGVVLTQRRVPNFKTTNGSTIVSNTESLIDVNAAALGAFSQSSAILMPSVPTWLSAVSDLYSKYRWRKLRLIYVPSCPTTTQGNAACSLTFDRLDAAPASLTAMQQCWKAITFPPYAGFEGAMALQGFGNVSGMVAMDVDTTRFDKQWYPVISPGALAALVTNVQNPYVPATFYVGSVNGPAAATFFGTFYIQYEVEFIEPVNPTQNA